MKTIYKKFKSLLKDESGQGAVEYILLLVVVVAIAMLFKDQIQGIVSEKVGQIRGNIQGFN